MFIEDIIRGAGQYRLLPTMREEVIGWIRVESEGREPKPPACHISLLDRPWRPYVAVLCT